MKRFVWVQIPSSALNKEDMPPGMSFLFYKDGGFEIGRKLRSNLSEGPNSLNDCLSAKAATGGNPVIRTNEKGTFGRQGFRLDLFARMCYNKLTENPEFNCQIYSTNGLLLPTKPTVGVLCAI